ncbi:MAG: hypothetical protein CMF12_08390 [Idiomarina sp.]|uniref:hypothetical protein n=1 Tax=Idiomarina sp. TaxID=1874361 RepID=UPI000C5373F6|nr:hypothetical protein [Idiomarina sp.]MBT42527.1 hypothetical protein [Idiomarina sp.]|tara:strand:- start:199 stop:717 length:519 start_codon:yes stop_codon:yes gene_type:complete
MESNKRDLEVSEKTKKASSLAREKKFDEAIKVLGKLIKGLEKCNLDHSDVCIKIIPYFQKAGRFDELESYVNETLIPVGRAVTKKSFSHQNKHIQDAFTHLFLSRVYDKVRLSAKREKNNELKSYYGDKSQQEYDRYEAALEKGEEIAADEGEKEMVRIFGADKSQWPDSIK